MALDPEPIYGKLPSGWKFTTVAHLVEAGLAEIQTGPFGTMLHASAYCEVGRPVVAVKNIGDNRLDPSDIPKVNSDTAFQLRRYELREGDVLFGRKGAVERRALVRSAEDGWLQGSDCIRLRFTESSVEPAFISYVFGTPQYKDWITRNAQGATMPSLNQEIIGRIPIPLPPAAEQRALIRLMQALDSKIDLNRDMSETLETMARAIFKACFIDLMLSGGGERVVFGPATMKGPYGWSVMPLAQCAEYVNGLSFRSDQFAPEGGLPIVKIAELKGGISSQTKFTEEEFDKRYLINSGDILLSWSGSPQTSIGTFLWASGAGWLNQHIFKVIPRPPVTREFIYLVLRYFEPLFIERARDKQTTGLGHITARDLREISTLVPSEAVMGKFSLTVSPLLGRILANKLESATLITIRDAILPKLFSGEIRVKQAEKIVGDVV